MQQHYPRPDGLPPANGYSHVVAFSGNMIIVSGQVPLDGQGTLVGKDDPPAQVTQVFENLATALTAAGARMDQVVKMTVFLTDITDLQVFRDVRNQYFAPDAPPASTLVQVSRLVNPDFRVEVEALAVT